MKKKNLKTRILAVSMSVITACSVGMATITSANAATFSFGDEYVDAVYNAEYQCGLGLISEFVPGGQAISGLIDSLVGSFSDKGPSLNDINNTISDFRKDVSREFNDVKNKLQTIQNQLVSSETAIREDITKQTQQIEQQIVTQTVIANKGSGFDGLMTALKETSRQIDIISKDDTLSEQGKAVQIAMLIGRNDKWNNSNNLYFNYMSYLNSLTNSTFCAKDEHDIFYYVYLSNVPYAMFAKDAKDFSKPYVERLTQLCLYTYSILAECLDAAQKVSSFTAEDIAQLNEDDVAHYHEIKSLKSVVDGTFAYLNKKVFDAGSPDSVASHLKSFNDINNRVYLNKGTVNIPLQASVIMDSNHILGNEYGIKNYDLQGGKNILNKLQNNSPLSFEDSRSIASYVKSVYPGKSLADYFMAIGFDNENLRSVHWRRHQLYLMTGEASVDYSGSSARLVYSGVNVHNTNADSTGVTSTYLPDRTREYGQSGSDYVLFFVADKT